MTSHIRPSETRVHIMTTLQNMTARKLANSIESAVNASALVAEAIVIAFAGKVVKAEKASLIHQTLVVLIDDRAKHNAKMDKTIKADKLNEKQTAAYKKDNAFQGLNMLQTMAGRAIKGMTRFDGKRISLKTTGKAADFSIALVSFNAKDIKSDASKKSSVTKGKQLQNLMNDSSISLVEAIAALIDGYTLAAVQAEVAKQS